MTRLSVVVLFLLLAGLVTNVKSLAVRGGGWRSTAQGLG